MAEAMCFMIMANITNLVIFLIKNLILKRIQKNQ